MKILLTLALASNAITGVTSITVRPSQLFVGKDTYVTCRVPPHADNRQIQFGLSGYTASTRQLDGLNAPITWQKVFERVPCGVDKAFCIVTKNTGESTIVTASINVVGCDEGGTR